jgi:hypothetical protein
LIGAAGNLVQTENVLAIIDSQRDEEGDLQSEHGTAPFSPTSTPVDVVPKPEGLIVFFPGKLTANRYQDLCLPLSCFY